MDIFDPLFYDAIAIAIVIISVLLAFFKGFLREFLSLVEWIGSFVISYLFHDNVATLLRNTLSIDTGSTLLSIALIFTLSFISLYFLGRVIISFAKDNFSQSLDRFLGLIFGFLRGILIPCIVFNFILILAVSPNMARAIMQSHSYGVVSLVTKGLYGKDPEQIMLENNKHISQSLQEL